MKTGKAGKDIIKFCESLHDGDLTQIGLQPKMCPAGIWTEGWGHAMTQFGKPLKGIENKELAYKLSKIKTEADAEEVLESDLIDVECAVTRLVKVPLTQNQFDALVSFTFNLGQGNFHTSTLLKKLNAGDYKGAADQFKYWNKSGGKVLPGLTTRRKMETDLFNKK
jgi:lysozyme